MIILGFDPGTARVGWGVVDTGKENHANKARWIQHGCIETDKALSDSKRLVKIAHLVKDILGVYKPDLVAIERLFFARNVTTAMTVSQARGVIMLITEQCGIPMVEYTPMQAKRHLTGDGRADKKQMQEKAAKVLGLPSIPKPDDAADALAIALTAAILMNKQAEPV